MYAIVPTLAHVGTDGPGLADLSVDQRPRERLRRLGADALTDAEIVAILLGSGQPGTNVLKLAQRVIAVAGGMAGLPTLTLDAAEGVPGVGPAAASRLVAAVEIYRRASITELPAGVATTRVRSAATACGLRFLDHILVAEKSWASIS